MADRAGLPFGDTADFEATERGLIDAGDPVVRHEAGEVVWDSARRPEQFHRLQEMLRLWRLRAVAYTSPGYRQRLATAPEGHATGVVPASQLIPTWPGGHQKR